MDQKGCTEHHISVICTQLPDTQSLREDRREKDTTFILALYSVGAEDVQKRHSDFKKTQPQFHAGPLHCWH